MHAALYGVTWLGTHLHLLVANLEGFLDFGLSKFPVFASLKERKRNITLRTTSSGALLRRPSRQVIIMGK